MSKKYTFREITEKEELEELFRMRYKIYSNCKLNGFVKSNDHQIDIDAYDLYSKHYALTCENENVGYLRIVLPADEIFQDSIVSLGRKYGMINGSFNSEIDKAPYPFLGYKETPNSYWDFYKTCTRNNDRFIEASRLILDPDHRTLRSSKFLIECAMVKYILLSKGLNFAIITCNDKHSAFYQHYGFREIDDNNGSQYPGGVEGTALKIPLFLSSIPQKHHSRFQEMADEFKSNEKIEKVY